jgi:S1-C subfamily serine protease
VNTKLSKTAPREQVEVLKSFSDALVSVVNQVSASVVQVSTGRGVGTGVVWDDQGHVVTNYHVVGRSNKIEVATADGKSMNAALVGQDRYSDIAVLKVEGKGSLGPAISRGESDSLATGQFVLALANPFGDRVSAASGIITNPKGRIGGPWSDDQIVTDVRLNRGYSGGPLVDATGKMIGMNAAYFANRGLAISVGVLTTTVQEILSSGSVKRAYLGIVSNPISLPEEIAESTGQNEGLIVLSVEAGTPAKKAGVAVGDIIVEVNSKKVESYNDLVRVLNGNLIGKEVELSVLRGEKETKLSIVPREA